MLPQLFLFRCAVHSPGDEVTDVLETSILPLQCAAWTFDVMSDILSN